jgi:hypothetical protein
MKILKWLLLLPIHILIIITRYPLAPIAVLLCSSADRKQLTDWRWLETIDNDLAGDTGWRNEHIKPGSDPLSFWNRVRWLWRNGGNSANYNLLGCAYDPNLPPLNTAGGVCLSRRDGYWLLRKFIPLFGKYLELFWGWGLYGPVNGRCKFTFTTRIKSKRD